MPKRFDTRLGDVIHGAVHPQFQSMLDAFGAVLDDDDAGAAVAVVRDGELVVDLWGGRDPISERPWERDSAALAFSTAKGIVAMLVAMQVRAGLIDPAAPVARYWPEFAAEGKERIAVADVLTHVAGLPALPLRHIDELLDPVALAARMAQSPPDYRPRTARVYHVLSYGVLAGELLRRVTGRDVGELVRECLAEPLDAALWFGLPEAEDARYLPSLMDPIVGPPAPTPLPGEAGRACAAAAKATEQIIPIFERVDGVIGTEAVNGVPFRRALVPGGGLVADARSLARVYGACVAEVDGVRLLDDATVRMVSMDWLGGVPEPLCLPGTVPTTRWGLGFELAHVHCGMLGDGSFGHAGMGGRLAFAHAPSRIGFAFVGQRMRFPAPGADERWRRLLGALEPIARASAAG